MIKIVLVIILLATTIIAKSFHFTELRYSDAFDSTIELLGEIRFETNSLFIKYDNLSRTILYKESDLIINQDGHKVELNGIQKQRISQFFEVLLLIHSDNNELLHKKFKVVKDENTILLKPKKELKNYLNKIILTKHQNEIKKIELFLSNDDKITIRLEDEVR